MEIECAICGIGVRDEGKSCRQCERCVCVENCFVAEHGLCTDCYYVKNPLKTPVLREFDL